MPGSCCGALRPQNRTRTLLLLPSTSVSTATMFPQWLLALVVGTLAICGASGGVGIESAVRLLALSDAQQQLCLGGEALVERTLPFVTISYAQTLDGSIAPLNRTRLDISSPTSFRLLHSLRARHDGVLVGINTVMADQPRLNVRDPLPGVDIPLPEKQPRPIVIDSELRILEVEKLRLERPIVCSCLLDGQSSIEVETRWVQARMRLEALGGHLVACKRQGGQCDLGSCLTALKQRLGVNSILIEGGAGIIQSVLEEGLADQVVLTLRPCFFGGYRALRRQLPKGPASLEQVSVASIGGDVVMHGLVSYPSHDAGDEAFTPPSRSLVHLLL